MGSRQPAAAAVLAAAHVVACSGSPATITTCGPGTESRDGTCVVSGAPDGALDAPAATEASDAKLDATPEAAPPTAEASTGRDASEPPADPCPGSAPGDPNLFLSCDAECDPSAPAAAICATATCSANPQATLPQAYGTTYVLRTPDAPGVDAQCAARCPGGGYVYGLGFEQNASNLYNMIITVEPPWEIVEYSKTPFCPDAHSSVTTGCAYLDSSGGGPIYIMTKDPKAPARNVTFASAGTKTSCP